jgi:hypothetical protein
MRVVIDASIDPRLVEAFPVKQLDLTPGHVAGYGGRTGGRERRIMLKGETP